MEAISQAEIGPMESDTKTSQADVLAKPIAPKAFKKWIVRFDAIDSPKWFHFQTFEELLSQLQ